MYNSFSVKNFRCFKDFSISPLERINLIAGKNNVGKTALLEALWIFGGPDVPDLGARLSYFRGLALIDPNEFMWDLFHNFDPKLDIELSATGTWGSARRYLRVRLQQRESVQVPLSPETAVMSGTAGTVAPRLTGQESLPGAEIVFEYTDEQEKHFTSRGWFVQTSLPQGILAEGIEKKVEAVLGRPNSTYLAARYRPSPKEDAERFGRILVRGKDDDVLEALKIVEPRLKRLVPVPLKDMSVIHGDIGTGRLIPVYLMGDGLARLLSLAVTFASVPHGTVLVDEIENGLHHTIITKVWGAVASFARKFDVQLFATTHSDECVRAAHRAFESDKEYDFRFHRLDYVDDAIRAITYDQEMLRTSLQSGLEVR